MKDLSSFFREKAEVLRKDGKFEESVRFLDKAKQFKQGEKSDDFWYQRAIHACELGEYEHAVECLDKDLVHHKKSYETYFLKGLIQQNLELFEESIESFNMAAEQRDHNVLHTEKKIQIMKDAKKFENAVLYADKRHKEKSLDDTFWYHKGISFLKLNLPEKALECFNKSIEKNHNNSKSHYSKAKCHLLLKNEQECINSLENSCFIDSKIKEILRIDADFNMLIKNREFRLLRGL